MSLLVHLPLLGDLRNIGLAGDVSVTNSGAIVNDSGKIGKCYEFGVAASQISLSVNELTSCSDVSVALWIKILSWNTSWATFFQAGKNSQAWADYVFGLLRNSSTSKMSFVIGNGSSTTTTYCSTGDLELNRWYHIVGTYSSGKLHLYVDGDQVSEYSTALQLNASVITKATIGRANGGSYQSNCLINDVRIYDHALSVREVKELSKGLVAHWKLDDLIGNENLLPKSDKAGNATTAWTWDGASAEAIDGYLKVYFTGSGNNRIYDYVADNTWVSGKTYTISLWAKTTTDGFALRLSRSLADYAPNISLTSEWKYYSVQIQSTATSASGTISIQSNKTGVAWIKFVKLEEGSVATQWIPAKTDDMYSYWELNKAHDSSGYDHDGILSPNPPKFELDTARYSSCLSFASASPNYIDCGIDTWLPTDQVSVAWWGYMMTWGSTRPISCTESGGWNFEAGTGGGFRFPVYKKGLGYAYGTPVKKWADYTSGWHFFVGTFDGYTTKIYVDGEFDSESTTATPATKAEISYNKNTKLFIGCEANGSAPYTPYFNGKLSDIRIYATALSADDIKELYNTSASIDNHHNVYARELVED